MKHIVSQTWLAERLNKEDVRIIDCRFHLNDPKRGLAEYIEDHILGAFYFDLEKDLSAPVSEHGGRHPLPSVEEVAEKLGAAGIDETVTVIAYDDQDGAMAARCWWLLRYLGHERVYVLDGNYTQWKEKGFPVTDKIPTVPPRSFHPRLQPSWLATVDDVRRAVREGSAVLIDSREWKRYAGIEEPIDCVAGHIPGAVHMFWKDGIMTGGYWKSQEQQAQRFASIRKDAPIIVYCGSGVTACPNVLALKEAGYTNVRLYAGSWSDWISYPDHPIASGEK